jgi:hypothetical protein
VAGADSWKGQSTRKSGDKKVAEFHGG